MTTPRTCSHHDTVPVNLESTGATVAHLCVCGEQLPANWTCTDCDWVVGDRRLCDRVAPRVLARACPAHERGSAA